MLLYAWEPLALILELFLGLMYVLLLPMPFVMVNYVSYLFVEEPKLPF